MNKGLVTLKWINTVAKQAQGIKEKDELTALHPGAFKCKCKKHVIAVNIYSRSECNMDFICTKLWGWRQFSALIC